MLTMDVSIGCGNRYEAGIVVSTLEHRHSNRSCGLATALLRWTPQKCILACPNATTIGLRIFTGSALSHSRPILWRAVMSSEYSSLCQRFSNIPAWTPCHHSSMVDHQISSSHALNWAMLVKKSAVKVGLAFKTPAWDWGATCGIR
jgi:hypothetical protein